MWNWRGLLKKLNTIHCIIVFVNSAMAEDEILFDDVYELQDVIGK